MAIVQLTDAYLTTLKRDLRTRCGVRPGHLAEAVARGFGFNTSIAMQAALRGLREGEYLIFRDSAFRERLEELGGERPDDLDLPALGYAARYVVDDLNNSALEVIEMHPMRTRFKLSGIDTIISIQLLKMRGGFVRFVRSHAIHTPVQAGPYWPSRDFDDEAPYALHRAISSLVDYYQEAVEDQHIPHESWLVPA